MIDRRVFLASLAAPVFAKLLPTPAPALKPASALPQLPPMTAYDRYVIKCVQRNIRLWNKKNDVIELHDSPMYNFIERVWPEQYEKSLARVMCGIQLFHHETTGSIWVANDWAKNLNPWFAAAGLSYKRTWEIPVAAFSHPVLDTQLIGIKYQTCDRWADYMDHLLIQTAYGLAIGAAYRSATHRRSLPSGDIRNPHYIITHPDDYARIITNTRLPVYSSVHAFPGKALIGFKESNNHASMYLAMYTLEKRQDSFFSQHALVYSRKPEAVQFWTVDLCGHSLPSRFAKLQLAQRI